MDSIKRLVWMIRCMVVALACFSFATGGTYGFVLSIAANQSPTSWQWASFALSHVGVAFAVATFYHRYRFNNPEVA